MDEKTNHSLSLDSSLEDAQQALKEYNDFVNEARSSNGKIIRGILSEQMLDISQAEEESEDYAGLYVHGGHKPLTLEEHDLPFASFRKYSEKRYPIYFFYHDNPEFNDKEVLDHLHNNYAPIQIIEIRKLETITEYSNFMMLEAFQALPESAEKVLTFQSDGFLKDHGWEKWVQKHDPDYVGAPWLVFLPEKDPEGRDIYVGNGGFSFRKRSKMLEVSDYITEDVIQSFQDIMHGHGDAPEDRVVCAIGFGKGIFKYIDPYLARQFSAEPYNKIEGIGFHSFI